MGEASSASPQQSEGSRLEALGLTGCLGSGEMRSTLLISVTVSCNSCRKFADPTCCRFLQLLLWIFFHLIALGFLCVFKLFF